VRGEKTQGGARDEKTRDEKTKSGVNLLSQERETSTTKVGEIVNARISLPRNWKQILVILVLLGALYLKLFGGPDFIPLSQVPMFSPPPAPEAQMPPPSEAPPATPQPPATVTPPSPRSHVSPPQAVPPVASQEESPNDNVDDDTNSDVPGDEAIRRPTPQEIAAAKRKNKPHQATKLHAHMSVQSDGGASLQVDTDAPSTQPVLIEISAGAGQVLDHSHFYRRARWTPGKGVSLGGELPSGYYKLRASVGNLSTEEKFEIGTHVKGFGEKLKQTRKQSAYEFWNERKHLYQAAQHLGKLIGTKRFSEIDRLSRFQATSFAFSDLWNDLKEICQLVKKSDPSAKGRLQTLQNKIAALSIWK
jgi:hypothetical protein